MDTPAVPTTVHASLLATPANPPADDGARNGEAQAHASGPPREGGHEPPSDLVCSARGCGHHADFGLLWNNPSLHTPERRKTWLACAEHRDHLSDFLGARGFLREVLAVDELAHP